MRCCSATGYENVYLPIQNVKNISVLGDFSDCYVYSYLLYGTFSPELQWPVPLVSNKKENDTLTHIERYYRVRQAGGAGTYIVYTQIDV